MALDKNFYNEIFECEQKWSELIKSNLLNSVYCNLTLKPFYVEKRKELKEEYNQTKNEIIKQIILIINDIINEIDLFNYEYVNYKKPNISSLLSLFLITKMNNDTQKDNHDIENKHEVINELQKEKQNLRDQMNSYNRNTKELEDYVYDDFPEEIIRVK